MSSCPVCPIAPLAMRRQVTKNTYLRNIIVHFRLKLAAPGIGKDRTSNSSSAMVVNGWWPGAENADHCENSKTKRLLQEH